MSYQNLKAEIVRRNYTQKEIAELLDMGSRNLSFKLAGNVPFTVPEIKKLQRELFPDVSLDYLCETDGDEPSIYDQLIDLVDVIGEEIKAVDGSLSPESAQTLQEMKEMVERKRPR